MHPSPDGVPGALLCLVSIFAPGLLLVLGATPFWSPLRRRKGAAAALAGVNAAVVGVLAAALYDPVWTTSVAGPADLAVIAAAFALLVAAKAPPWLVIALCAAAGAALA